MMNRIEMLQERIQQLYNAYLQTVRSCTNMEIINQAEDIAFVKQAAELLYYDAEELPEFLEYHIHHSDFAITDLLSSWNATKCGRMEDDREVIRNLFVRENAKLSNTYSIEDIDDEIEM